MAYIARADGTREDLAAARISLKEAQRIVGGYVERVAPIHNRAVIFLCNEEGLLKGLPRNDHGCELYGPSSPVVGDIIVMSREEAAAADWL